MLRKTWTIDDLRLKWEYGCNWWKILILWCQQLRDTCTWDVQSRVISLAIWIDRTTIESSSSLRNVHKLSLVSDIKNNSPILRISYADPTKSKHFQAGNALHLAILKNHPSIHPSRQLTWPLDAVSRHCLGLCVPPSNFLVLLRRRSKTACKRSWGNSRRQEVYASRHTLMEAH